MPPRGASSSVTSNSNTFSFSTPPTTQSHLRREVRPSVSTERASRQHRQDWQDWQDWQNWQEQQQAGPPSYPSRTPSPSQAPSRQPSDDNTPIRPPPRPQDACTSARTTLSVHTPANSRVLEVRDHSRFCLGQEIIIGYGTERAERAVIAFWGSFGLSVPTIHEHFPNEQIVAASFADRSTSPHTSSPAPAALTNHGAQRDAAPLDGPDTALGSAFSTQGRSNEDGRDLSPAGRAYLEEERARQEKDLEAMRQKLFQTRAKAREQSAHDRDRDMSPPTRRAVNAERARAEVERELLRKQ